MKKTALILMILTILSKFLGFTREITLSFFYGASNISDAYLISVTIPGVIFAFLGTALSTSYIPMFNNIYKNEGVKKVFKFSNNIINFLLIISTFIVILGLFFTEGIVKLFASGFEGETLSLAINFTRISIFGVYFTGLIYIFNSYLQIKRNFVIPALIGFPLNLIIILSIFLASKGNIFLLSIGTLIATASQLLFILPFAYKNGYRYSFVLNLKDPYLKKVIYLALPVILGTSVNQINTLVDRTLASQIAVGGISALNYANKLNGFVQGIFVVSISTVMYPVISQMVAEENIKGLKQSLSESINLVNLLVIPTTLGSMLFAEPVVRLLFGRGAFNETAIKMTSYALFFYSIGMIGFGLRDVLSRAFYSLQDTKTPMINATIGMVLNIVLNIILSKYIGIGGLALATSISSIFITLLLFINLRKKIGPFGIKTMVVSFVKIVAASLVMGVIAKLANIILLNFINSNIALIFAIGIGAGSYFLIISFMKIPEVDTVVKNVKKKFNNDFLRSKLGA